MQQGDLESTQAAGHHPGMLTDGAWGSPEHPPSQREPDAPVPLPGTPEMVAGAKVAPGSSVTCCLQGPGESGNGESSQLDSLSNHTELTGVPSLSARPSMSLPQRLPPVSLVASQWGPLSLVSRDALTLGHSSLVSLDAPVQGYLFLVSLDAPALGHFSLVCLPQVLLSSIPVLGVYLQCPWRGVK